jgi:hypothetical protein
VADLPPHHREEYQALTSTDAGMRVSTLLEQDETVAASVWFSRFLHGGRDVVSDSAW